MKMSETDPKTVETSVDNSPERKKRSLPKNVVKKKGDPNWYARRTITVGGKQKQVWKICDSKTAQGVKDALAEIDAEIARARSGAPQKLVKFSEIADKYEALEFTEAVFQNEKKVSGKIQLYSPKLYIKKLKTYFGDQPIETITITQIKELKLKRLAEKIKKIRKTRIEISPSELPKGAKKSYRIEEKIELVPRSIRSVNYELSLLKQIVNFSIRNRWMAFSPFFDDPSLLDHSLEHKRHLTWTKEEERQALELSTEHNSHMKAVIICLVDGGFRIGELLAAKWKEVDFENGIMLAKSYKGKNLHVRAVYLTKRMKAALLEWKAIQKSHFKKPDPSLVIGFKTVTTAWNHIRLAIHRPELHLHDLRHVFGTRLNQKRVPLRNIQLLLGHSKLTTTQIYLNPAAEDLRDSIKVLED